MNEDDRCYICGEDIGLESHCHCPNCGEVCSSQGHAAPQSGYSCTRSDDYLAVRTREYLTGSE